MHHSIHILPLCAVAILGCAATPTDPQPEPELDEHKTRIIGKLGLTGLRFGGLIGGSAELSLRLFPEGAVEPEFVGGVGVSGTKLGLGARWVLGERRWEIGGGKGPALIDTSSALTARAVAYYRWQDEEREPDFWRGMVSREGWYRGFELGLTDHGIALDLAVTWHDDRDEPHVTLAYGFAF